VVLRYVLSKGIIGPIIIGRRKCDIGKIISIKIAFQQGEGKLWVLGQVNEHGEDQQQFIICFVIHTNRFWIKNKSTQL